MHQAPVNEDRMDSMPAESEAVERRIALVDGMVLAPGRLEREAVIDPTLGWNTTPFLLVQNGRKCQPSFVCHKNVLPGYAYYIVDQELEYWGLTELDIEPCCWGHYSQFKDHKETLAALDDNFTTTIDVDAWGDKLSDFQRFKRRMWELLEDPSSSRTAKVFAVASMFFVVLSISIFCLETYDKFRVPLSGAKPTNSSSLRKLTVSPLGDYCISQKQEASSSYAEFGLSVCSLFYTGNGCEICFLAKKTSFSQTPTNTIDFLCLIPHLIAIILITIDPNDTTSQLFKSMLVLRIVRILRIFKLMKHYSAFKILVYTIKVSTKELLLLVVFLFTGVLIFASLIFHAEMETFPNIPLGIWWALVTMTTVGYGDKVPVTEAGYVIGCVCVLCGVLTVAFTVPIVVNNFTLYYAHAQSRIKLPVHKRKELKRKLVLRSKKSLEFLEKLKSRAHKRRQSDFAQLDVMNTPRESPYGQEDDPKDAVSVARQQSNSVYVHGTNELLEDEPQASNTKQHKIHTISDTVVDTEYPSSPGSVETADEQHKIETQQLLNDLDDANRRLKEERKRQLGILNLKREQKMINMNEITRRPRQGSSTAEDSAIGYV
ncbi:hypothetical protein ScPMuIL_018733 [Solemya velum]